LKWDTPVITADKDEEMSTTEFVYVTYINTTPEKVWNALIDNEMIKQYWGYHKNVSDWQVGSTWLHQDYDTGTTDIEGKVVDVDKPKRLVLTWAGARDELLTEKAMRVTFEIEPFLDVARLTLTHDELEVGSKMLKRVTEGWPKVISSLKTLLETGQAIDITASGSERVARAAAK
jgi:uncharacterized protein YndB with AHSA1/START domain